MAARPWMTVGPVQPGLGCAATPMGLSTTSRSSSSYSTTRPATDCGATERVSGAGKVTSSNDPPCTLALRGVAAPSRLTWPLSMRSAAAVRENPSSREIATSRRNPSSPSGTGNSRVSATGAGLCVEVDTEHAENSGQDGAAHDRRVGEVEDRPVGPVGAEEADPVDDVSSSEPGRAEDAVDEVAERATEHQAERDRPAGRAHPAGSAQDHGHHRERDDREDHREPRAE